ncbi:MAG TPA: hypothetical protein VGK79_00645 [Gaiellaceae bacterium]
MLDGDLAHALAAGIHYEWTDDERELLAPLIDATIMRVDCERLDEIARPFVDALWDELRSLVGDTLREQAMKSDFVRESLEDAVADLELGPRRSRLASAVIQQAAVDLADHEFFLESCLDCIEAGLEHAWPAPRPELVGRAAAALALHRDPDYGAERPDDRERAATRARVRALAELGRESLPRLAPALAQLADEPLPPVGKDGVLQAVLKRRRAARAHLN